MAPKPAFWVGGQNYRPVDWGLFKGPVHAVSTPRESASEHTDGCPDDGNNRAPLTWVSTAGTHWDTQNRVWPHGTVDTMHGVCFDGAGRKEAQESSPRQEAILEVLPKTLPNCYCSWCNR